MRINVIEYSERGEEYIFAVLDASVNAVEYIKSLNEGIEAYNADIDAYWEKKNELDTYYGTNKQVEELTGMELISHDKYPRFPGQVPKGTRSVQEAYPEIHAERQRIDAHNTLVRHRYESILNDLRLKVEEDLNPIADALIKKYPMYPDFVETKERIWSNFELKTIRYIGDNPIEKLINQVTVQLQQQTLNMATQVYDVRTLEAVVEMLKSKQ